MLWIFQIEAQIIEPAQHSAPPDGSLRRSRPGSRTPSRNATNLFYIRLVSVLIAASQRTMKAVNEKT